MAIFDKALERQDKGPRKSGKKIIDDKCDER